MADFANVQPDEYKLLGCNFSAGRPFGIKGVTIHHMAGDLNAAQCNSIWRQRLPCPLLGRPQTATSCSTSTISTAAYACGDGIGTGRGNDTTISIEHANSGSNPWTVHEKAIESGAHLVAALCLYYGPRSPRVVQERVPAPLLERHGLPRRACGLPARPLHAARPGVVRRDEGRQGARPLRRR